ncbi:MAG: M1 family aminopeptidase, partial [Flavobacteriales bacterium]
QGEFLGEVQLGGDTVVRSYTLPQAIPTHLSAVAVADYSVSASTHTGVNGDIPVTLIAKPANLGNMVAKFGDLGAAIDACEHWYGPYAYDRVGYVLTTDGALEIPTNVAYPDFMPSQPADANRDLYSHELGHHWWGDIVTPYVHNDMWLKEGPAEYTGHLVAEWIGGQPALIKAVKDNQLFVLKQAHINDDDFQALSPMPDPYIYGTHTYYKGAAVLHNLRGYLGDEVFRQAMRDVQLQYANTAITAVGFKEALEGVTGQDLDPFFDAWVFAPGFATFEVRDFTAQQNGGAWDVDMTIGQKLRGTTAYHQQVPMDVTFISADGEVHDTETMASGELTDVTLTAPFEPAMVILNRYARLNQNRMDHEEVIVPGVSFSNVLPYVDFRAYGDNIIDTTYLRVEHIWAAPDQGPLANEVVAISNTHYWNVDGRWPEGTVLRGRLFYYGNNADALDDALIAGDESGIAVLYRPDPTSEWFLCPDQEVLAGSLTNGTGYINMNGLRKGQYCFGKINGFVGIAEEGPELDALDLYPVPATDHVTVSGVLEGAHLLVMDLFDASGRRLERHTLPMHDRFTHRLDVSALAAGSYALRVVSSLGHDLGTRRFDVR